ncbi:hypothetical protein GVAV_000097 [Gurleya vavrai]
MNLFCLLALSLSSKVENELGIMNKDLQTISNIICNELKILELAYSKLIINNDDKPNTINESIFDFLNSMNHDLEKVIAKLEIAINKGEDTIKIIVIIEIFQIVVFKYINFLLDKKQNEPMFNNNRFFILIRNYICIHFIKFSLATFKEKEFTEFQQMFFDATSNLQYGFDINNSIYEIINGIQDFFVTITNYFLK